MPSLDKITTIDFLETAPLFPAHQAILLVGNTGIGKSQLMYQLADILNLPLIDRRLSQMMEGDLLGLPQIKDNVTSFCPPDWVHNICEKPYLLFLDEINRAENHLQQMIFQLILDRRIQDFEIHPQTRICAAMNVGSHYFVNQMDPALIRRFWICELAFSSDLWLEWASLHINKIMYDFLSQNPQNILKLPERGHIGAFPNPASWHRFSDIISTIPPKLLNAVVVNNIGKGLVGEETTKKLLQTWNFFDLPVSSFEKMINGDLPVSWMKKQSIIGLSNMIPSCIEMLQGETLNDEQTHLMKEWMHILPNEALFYLYKEILDKKIEHKHPYIKEIVHSKMREKNYA